MRDTRNIKILIRATNWIGDSIMSLPALLEIRKNFPDAHISVLSRSWVKPIFEANPCVDQIIVYDKNNMLELIRTIKLLRNIRFDIAVLFQNAFEAALIAFFAAVKIRVGLDTDGRGFLLTHPVKPKKNQHHIKNYLDILKGMGIKAKESEPVLYVKDEYLLKANEILKDSGIMNDDFLIGLAPGAIYGPAKRWPAQYFAEIADMAIKRWKAKVVIFGSKKEKDICSKVEGFMKYSPLNLCAKTSLGVAMGIIKRCNMFVSNDSGLMHVAAALGIPTIAIFGSTNPEATGPKGRYIRIVRNKISCSPCLRRKCPYNTLDCLYSIKAEQVWKNMEEMRDETSCLFGQRWNNK